MPFVLCECAVSLVYFLLSAIKEDGGSYKKVSDSEQSNLRSFEQILKNKWLWQYPSGTRALLPAAHTPVASNNHIMATSGFISAAINHWNKILVFNSILKCFCRLTCRTFYLKKDHWRRQQSEHKSTEGVPVYSINPSACREIAVLSSLYKSLLSLQKKVLNNWRILWLWYMYNLTPSDIIKWYTICVLHAL